jgi:hypothetical protein
MKTNMEKNRYHPNQSKYQNGLNKQRKSRIIKMKQQKDLYDLFRDNKHKLDEAPNPQAWRRLEKRLDTRRATRGSSIYRIMSMAAGVLLLLGVFSLLPALESSDQDNTVVAMDTPPSEMEDLVVDPNSTEHMIKVVEFSRQYKDRMVQPIEEGNSGKKLIPSTQVRSNSLKKLDNLKGDSIPKIGSEG